MEYRKGFTDISQFTDNNICDPLVVSDHSEIMLNTKYGIISSWNISNPNHHHYFSSWTEATFARTHMCGDQNFLDDKINRQIEYIIDSFDSGKIPIHIIVEGYHTFFEKLKTKLNFVGSSFLGFNYALIYDETTEDPQNTVGILINLNEFQLIDSYLFKRDYIEEGDRITQYNPEKRFNNLTIPIVHLKTIDNKILIVGGVHLRGSNSRNPITGLSKINELISELVKIKNTNNDIEGIVIMGDFNTMPTNSGKIIKNVKLLLPKFPTHANPNNQVSYYDHTLVIGLPNSYMLSIEYLSKFSQALINSINRSRVHYLESL